MDRSTLVAKLKVAFSRAEQDHGIVLDWFTLTPAYEGAIPDLFRLAVSTPSFTGISCYQRIKRIVDYMTTYMPAERKHIAIVQVFDTKEALKQFITNELQEDACHVCERVLHIEDELIAV